MAQRGTGAAGDKDVQLEDSSLRQVFSDYFDAEKEDPEWHEKQTETANEHTQESGFSGDANIANQHEMMIRRSDLVITDWSHVDGQGAALLRKEAVYLGLAVSRSSSRRIFFYPRGQSKIGKTFLSFTRTKKNSQRWVCTGDVTDVLAR